ERGGFRIGIIGLEADLSSNVSATISSRIPQLDDVEVTNRWAEYLRDTEKCDLVILLSHIGYEEDRKLVPQTRNLDLVIGGHSHTFVDEMIYVRDLDGRKVPVVTDGCFGVEMGEVKIY
ncbi:MAG TPA: bifunctional metallophosphatase/5'-nucleotidase, partial [Candidatus Cryptobacteroides merdipullorum]|nr:bifunctional metallophosphatase/5'-nucleotidase [Candidatus Cryptobacteroides merdipullorum]